MTSNDILWCQQLKLNMRVDGQISDILSFIAAYHWEAVQERWILRNNLIKPATDAIITSWVETTELFQCFISSALSVLLPRKLDLLRVILLESSDIHQSTGRIQPSPAATQCWRKNSKIIQPFIKCCAAANIIIILFVFTTQLVVSLPLYNCGC